MQSQIYVPAPRSPSLTAAPGIDAYIHAQTGGHSCGERAFLSEMGDPDLIDEKDKTYFVLRRSQELDNPGYGAPLPPT
ncbi:MAG: hypothetical protein VCF24_24395 [Candidatus Latescibacterota bacterium]